MTKPFWIAGILLLSCAAAEEKLWERLPETNGTQEVDIYTRNCIPCHEYLPSSLERMFMNYLKTYSG
ncbi:MAG TPA: hypothetical protein ENK86_05230, partial [Campylobacterales bacterium]|nr:hypothetical protein [Campylobacterales bacterium]